MQFVTVRGSHAGKYHVRRIRGGRGWWFDCFDWVVDHDPSSEDVGCWFSSDPAQACLKFLQPDIALGVQRGCEEAAKGGVRFCGISFTVPYAVYHDVDTTPEAIRARIAECLTEQLVPHTVPLAPLSPGWLTAEVVALAQGLSGPDVERARVLSDALRDAGCEDPLVHDHLNLCPDHGPSCWIAEMIRHAQTI